MIKNGIFLIKYLLISYKKKLVFFHLKNNIISESLLKRLSFMIVFFIHLVASISANHQMPHAGVNVTTRALHYQRLQSCLRLPKPKGHLCLALPPLQTLVPAI